MKAILLSLVILFTGLVAQELFKANGNLILRDKYPTFPLYKKGKQIAIVKKGTVVMLLEKKRVFVDEWWKVRVMDNNLIGWLYNGEKDDIPYLIKYKGDINASFRTK